MIYTIKNNTTEIKINSLGAEVRSVVHNGRERAWQNDNGGWSGCAILLFPFAGFNRMIYEGVDFGIQKHGFCRNEEFNLVSQAENSIEFELCANDRTRAVYPYEFAFRVKYELVSDGYEVSYTVENKDLKEIPFVCGGHESFSLDEEVDSYYLLLEKEENIDFLVHNDGGMLTGEKNHYGVGNRIDIEKDFTDNNATVILGDINSRAASLYHKQTNEKVVEITFDGFSNLLLWHPHDSKMICIEPWQALPSYVDEIKEFKEREGVLLLQSKEQTTFTRTIKY